MDGLTGSYSKLRDTKTPLGERIELSRKILRNNEYFLPNKSQVIADWLCEELGNSNIFRSLLAKKGNKDALEVDEQVTELWRMLSEVLNDSMSEQIVLRQKNLSLFFRELDEIESFLRNYSPGSKLTHGRVLFVFLCFKAISKNPNMSLTFFNKLENLEKYMKGLVTCFLGVLCSQPNLHSANFVEELFELVVIVLHQYAAAQNQQVTKSKIFTNLCEKSLRLLLLVKTVIQDTNIFQSQSLNRNDMCSAIDDVIISGLFHKDLILNCNPTAIPRQQAKPSLKKPKLVNSYNLLFDVLEKFAKGSLEDIVDDLNIRSEIAQQTIRTSLPFLLESFLKAAEGVKLDRASKFSFFVELYNVTANDLSDKQLPEVTRIEILNKLLHVIVVYDVYHVAEDNVNNQEIFKWFQSLVESKLLSQTNDSPVTFYCLDAILKLNHKIIEQFLETVLMECFVESEQCSEARIKLLCNVVEIYTKLQQTEKLIACVLKVFNKLGNKLGIIPVQVLSKLSKSFDHCHLNQTLSIAQLFLKAMIEQVQSVEDGNSEFSTKGMSILFVTFLLNSCYNASDPHGVDVKKAKDLMELVKDVKMSIIAPLIEAFPKCRKTSQEEVGFAALYLIYGLNSLVLFLHRHNVIPTSDEHYVQMFWDSEAYIPAKTWKSLALLRKNGCLRFCMELLALQRMQGLLLKRNLDQNEFDKLVKFLYAFQDPETIPGLSSVSWKFDLSCVTSMNYPVAHWSLVNQYALVFIPYCSEDQLQTFAEFMVRSLVVEETKIMADNLTTLYGVSENILRHGELLSLSSLQTAVVKHLWKMLGESMGQVVGSVELSGVFRWEEFDDQSIEEEDADGTFQADEVGLQPGKINMIRAVSLAQKIAKVMKDTVDKSSKKRSKQQSSCGDLKMVSRLLKLLQRLPCHQFTQSNQVQCLLGSLACDVLLGDIAPDDQILAVGLSCREIVITLLQGFLQHREFSAWRVVDITSLLGWCYRTFLQGEVVKTSSGNLESTFLNASKKLLELAVIVSLKSPNRDSLKAIVDFCVQLVTSLTDSVKNASSEIIPCVDVLFIAVSACTEFLDQKGKNKVSLNAASSIISDTLIGLESFLKSVFVDEDAGFCHQEESNTKLETMIMKLCGILTRAMGLIPEFPTNEDFSKAFEGWTEIVSELVVKVLRKIKDVEALLGNLDFCNGTTTFITVLEDVFKGCSEHCASISEELRAQILRKCLQVLRKVRFSSRKQVGDADVKCSEESSELQEAVLGLFVAILEENEGVNCMRVLEGVLQWSVEENEANKDSSSNLLTGFGVFKDLLASKVVKKGKKELRSIAGKIAITLLSKAATNVEVLCVVLETVATLVNLDSGVFYPQDLALVFHSLALNLEATDLELFSRIFTARFAILSWTLFYYPDYVYGAVHVFLPCVRELLNSLLTQGAKLSDGSAKLSDGEKDSQQAATLTSLVQKMSRLYQEMASHKDVLSKYSVYFLADCVHVMSTQGIPGIIRDELVQGVHFLFDICNDDGLTKLHVYLPSNERELFRSLKDDYAKHHKFKGNA